MMNSIASLGKDRHFRICALLVVIHTLFRITVAAVLPLHYKEAYYWEWSRFLSYGYLDHPPLVAWLIRGSTWLFGQRCVFAVRLPALACGAATLVVIYQLARRIFADRTVALNSLILAFCLPMLSMAGIFIVTDSALVLFSLLALLIFIGAAEKGRTWRWCVLGVVLGLALLSKVPAGLTIAALGLFLIVSKEHRHWLRRKEPYIALFIAIALFCPYLYWNWQHDWASFGVQFSNRLRILFRFKAIYLAEYLFEQLVNTTLLALPVFGTLFIRAAHVPENCRAWFRLLRIHSLTVLAAFMAAGSVTQTHPHWTLIAYPPAIIALAGFWKHRRGHFVARPVRGLVIAVQAIFIAAIIVAPIAIPILSRVDLHRFNKTIGRNYATAKVRLLGVPALARQIDEVLYDQYPDEKPLLFADGYRLASTLSFYRAGEPVVNVRYLLPTHKLKVGDAQRFYILPTELYGRSGVMITERHGPWALKRVEQSKLFENVAELEPIEQEYEGQLIRTYQVLRVENFGYKLTASSPHVSRLHSRHRRCERRESGRRVGTGS